MESRDEERVLPCRLNELDLLERGRELSDTYDRYETIEAKKKAAAAEAKEELDSARDELKRLSRIIAKREEPRVVKCQWKSDFDGNRKICFRTDTGEVVEERALTASERQGQLLT
jgi:hypothetical protein